MAKSRNNQTAEKVVNLSELANAPEEVRQFIQPYLNSYPNEDTFYITFDKQVFLGSAKNDAINHQRGIDPDNQPIELKRDEA